MEKEITPIGEDLTRWAQAHLGIEPELLEALTPAPSTLSDEDWKRNQRQSLAKSYLRDSGLPHRYQHRGLDDLDYNCHNAEAISAARDFVNEFGPTRRQRPTYWMVLSSPGDGPEKGGKPVGYEPRNETGNGTGKTSIAAAMARDLCCKLRRVVFLSDTRLMDFFNQATFDPQTPFRADDLLRDLREADAVFIDDLGTAPEANKRFRSNTIYSVINTLFEIPSPLVITTNLAARPGEFKHASDVQAEYGGAVISRIDEMCWNGATRTWLTLGGPDRRVV